MEGTGWSEGWRAGKVGHRTPVWGELDPGRGHCGTTNKVGTQVGVHVVGREFNISLDIFCVDC